MLTGGQRGSDGLPRLMPERRAHRRLVWTLILAAGALMGTVAVLRASGRGIWQADGIAVPSGIYTELDPAVASDGAGGAIVAWEDSRHSPGPPQIYAQRVRSDGSIAWVSGDSHLSKVGMEERDPAVVEDGQGGAIVAWHRNAPADVEDGLYVQKVLSDGGVEWSTGITVSESALWYRWAVSSDGQGGAVAVWLETGLGKDLSAQRVLSDGTMAWGSEGVTVSVAAGDQDWPVILGDGDGGAIVAYVSGSSHILAQRVYSNGTLGWTTEGVSVCTHPAEVGSPSMATDGLGGTIVVWSDARNGSSGWDIYAQRVLSDGTMMWTTDGVSLCTAMGEQTNPMASADGAHGATVVWNDQRPGVDYGLYARRVLSDGSVAWATDGVSVCTTCLANHPSAVSDGAGNVVAAWSDGRNALFDIHVQLIRPDGALGWQAGGLPLCIAPDVQEFLDLASTGAEEAVVVWDDYRGTGYATVYAQRAKSLPFSVYLPVTLRTYGP